jgi:hypothetical protein
MQRLSVIEQDHAEIFLHLRDVASTLNPSARLFSTLERVPNDTLAPFATDLRPLRHPLLEVRRRLQLQTLYLTYSVSARERNQHAA